MQLCVVGVGSDIPVVVKRNSMGSVVKYFITVNRTTYAVDRLVLDNKYAQYCGKEGYTQSDRILEFMSKYGYSDRGALQRAINETRFPARPQIDSVICDQRYLAVIMGIIRSHVDTEDSDKFILRIGFDTVTLDSVKVNNEGEILVLNPNKTVRKYMLYYSDEHEICCIRRYKQVMINDIGLYVKNGYQDIRVIKKQCKMLYELGELYIIQMRAVERQQINWGWRLTSYEFDHEVRLKRSGTDTRGYTSLVSEVEEEGVVRVYPTQIPFEEISFN